MEDLFSAMDRPAPGHASGPAPDAAPGPSTEQPAGEVPPPADDDAFGNELAVGDCLELMRSWPADSVDLIFSDPPYNIGYEYGEHYQDNQSPNDYIDWTNRWIDGCVHLLKPTGSFYILIGDEYAAETRVYLRSLENAGKLCLRNWIIWHYTFGQNCKAKFNRSHAHLFYCVGSAVFTKKRKSSRRSKKGSKGPQDQDGPTGDDGHAAGAGDGDGNFLQRFAYANDVGPTVKFDVNAPPFTFNRQAIAVPSARQTTYRDARANPTGKLPDDTWYLRPQAAMDMGESYFDADADTWYVSRLCGTFKERQGWHPCQLPEALLERIIRVSSNPGDLVFDPFTGSGTTLAVAARLGRRWLGCELGQEYRDKALERIAHSAQTGQTQRIANEAKETRPGFRPKKPEPHRARLAESGD